MSTWKFIVLNNSINVPTTDSHAQIKKKIHPCGIPNFSTLFYPPRLDPILPKPSGLKSSFNTTRIHLVQKKNSSTQAKKKYRIIKTIKSRKITCQKKINLKAKSTQLIAGEVTHRVKVLAGKPDELSSIPGTHTIQREKGSPQVALQSPHI